MSPDDPLDLDRIDQAIRINELRHEAEELTGGQMTAYEADDCPADLAESFWQHVVDCEKTPFTCQFVRLTEQRLELPDPDTLTDPELTAKLWEVIHALAALQTFLSSTDHLSDRELYTHLWDELLWERTPDLPTAAGWNCHLDILGGCSMDDIQLRMRYYADDQERADWLASWPDDPMPERETPPYDRDRHLPRSRH